SRITDINEINRNNNSNNNAPVRVLPNNQAPQTNRNESPVNNNRPSISPNQNNAPVRTLPDNNQNPPAQINRNSQQQNEIRRNEVPVNNTPARAPQVVPQNNAPVNTPATQPVREFNNDKNGGAPVRNSAIHNIKTPKTEAPKRHLNESRRPNNVNPPANVEREPVHEQAIR